MKVLIVNTHHFLGGGDSTYSFNLAENLRENDHAVSFFAMQDRRNFPDPNEDLFVSPIDFKSLNQQITLQNGLKVLSRVIYSTEAYKNFSKLITRVHPELIHINSLHGHISPSVIFTAKRHRIPVVWTLHDYKLICPNTHFLIDASGKICEACGNKKYYQALLNLCKKDAFLASGMASLEAYAHSIMQVRNRVDAFLAPSIFLKNKMLSRGFPESKIHHIPYLLNHKVLTNSRDGNGKHILFLGKLTKIKGIFPLIEASREAPEVKVVLAGRVDEHLESKLSGILPRNAEYVGLKHGQDLWDLLNSAKAVVLPSLWYENQPFSILEAFAFGKPVIASDLGGMSELVKHKERGLLVPPGSNPDLAEAMEWIWSHPDESKKMGENARQYVLTNHSPESHYELLMGVYDKLLQHQSQQTS